MSLGLPPFRAATFFAYWQVLAKLPEREQQPGGSCSSRRLVCVRLIAGICGFQQHIQMLGGRCPPF